MNLAAAITIFFFGLASAIVYLMERPYHTALKTTAAIITLLMWGCIALAGLIHLVQ